MANNGPVCYRITKNEKQMKHKNYVFGLYDGETLLDTTNIDENDPSFARELFLEDFGWNEKYKGNDIKNLKVQMIEITEDSDYILFKNNS